MNNLDRTTTINGHNVQIRIRPEASNGYVVQAFLNNRPVSRRFSVEAETMADLSQYTGMNAVEELAALAKRDAAAHLDSPDQAG